MASAEDAVGTSPQLRRPVGEPVVCRRHSPTCWRTGKGIAVGMAYVYPAAPFAELCDWGAASDREADAKSGRDQISAGPDFPTSGVIVRSALEIARLRHRRGSFACARVWDPGRGAIANLDRGDLPRSPGGAEGALVERIAELIKREEAAAVATAR